MRLKNTFIYLTHFIFALLIYQTFEKESKKVERIKNSIKYIFSNLEGLINETSFSILHEKYNISFNNLRILKPFINENEIYEEKNSKETFYKLNNFVFNYKAEVNIKLFSDNEDLIKYGDIFFEINFENIKLKLVSDYLIKYEESNINFVNYTLFKDLNFFSNFNQRKNFTFYESGKSPINIDNLNLKLKVFFHTKFEERIKKIEKIFNILTYDLTQILDKSPNEFNLSYAYLEYIKINKIQTKPNYIIIDQKENSIKLYDINITGIYIVLTFEINFNINCAKNIKNIPYIILNRNKSNNIFELNIENCTLTDDNSIISLDDYKNEVFESIKNIYYKHLENIFNNYYNIYLNSMN